jgi:hypothetical protein
VIRSEVLICRFVGVPFSQYDEWRDSMSDEYFVLLCSTLAEMTNVLIRVM